jgi:cytosine/adenosine deaminase-related metal-dependent hydrolase
MPIMAPLIEDGAVVVDGNRIAAVGRFAELSRGHTGEVEDLGEVILLPGLINAHCHLDYTMLRGAILAQKSFSSWVRRINEVRRTLSNDDLLASIAAGFAELRRWGTTGVFNIESYPELMVQMPPPPIRTWWFYELLDVRSRIDTEDVVIGALTFFDRRPAWLGGFGLSPHAPYSTSLDLYRLAKSGAEKHSMPLTTHLAESDEEFSMFESATGPLHDFVRGLGRDMSDAGGITPIGHLLDGNALPRGAILVHMNRLGSGDEERIAAHAGAIHVVHCPNCHTYFCREPFPFETYRRLGISVSLGTDSCASNRELNLFAEMRAFREAFPNISPDELLRMVTVQPARAIGMAGALGILRENALADLITIPWSGSTEDAVEAVIENRTPIEWMLVDGRAVETC